MEFKVNIPVFNTFQNYHPRHIFEVRKCARSENHAPESSCLLFKLSSRDIRKNQSQDFMLMKVRNPKSNRPNQLLQCKHCPYKTTRRENIKGHIRVHKQSMPFDCQFCGKKFTFKGNKKQHELTRICIKKGQYFGQKLSMGHEFKHHFGN